MGRRSQFVEVALRHGLGYYARSVTSSRVPLADCFGEREGGDGVMCSSCVVYIRLLGVRVAAGCPECAVDVWSRLTIASRVGIFA